MMALAVAFDDLISKRPNKIAMDLTDALGAVLVERGKQFDPDLVDAFIAQFDEIQAVADSYPDE